MENVKKLTEALSLMQGIPCTGKENMTRMLIAMQRITEVATDLAENGDGKE